MYIKKMGKTILKTQIEIRFLIRLEKNKLLRSLISKDIAKL